MQCHASRFSISRCEVPARRTALRQHKLHYRSGLTDLQRKDPQWLRASSQLQSGTLQEEEVNCKNPISAAIYSWYGGQMLTDM